MRFIAILACCYLFLNMSGCLN